MRNATRLTLASGLIGVLALPDAAHAQRADTASRANATRAELPLKPARTVKFTTDEGTWMSVDVSPDGRTLVFDLAGDLYTLPIAGGKATRITDGMAFDAQPRWSPDGQNIVYVTDRDGSDDVWVVDAEGKNARQITRTDRTQFLSPEFTPDGKYIVVSRNAVLFGTQYNLYLYHKDGGTGVRVTGNAPAPAGGAPAGPGGPGAGAQRNYVGAAFGKDSRYIYASSRNGGAAGYNQTSFDWTVVAYDRETGETTPRAAAQGGAFKPVLSPDGKWLVYATRADTVTSLRIRDTESGDEHWLVQNVQRDDMESRFTRDLMPNMTFTPDSKSLIAAWNGKIRRVDVATGRATEIPFTADVEQQLGALSKFDYAINDSTLTVAQIRGARPSPDGKRLAFTALDKLWIMDLPSGTPRRLTKSRHETGEHSPVWSPDGRYLTYLTWADQGGDIYRIASASPNATPERLTRQTAFYTAVNYTPNGQRLVAYKSPKQPRLEEGFQYGRELVWLPAAGGVATSVAPVPGTAGFPHFTREDNDRIYIAQGGTGLVSMRFDGTDRKTHIKVTGNPDYRQATPQPQNASEILISPNGDRVMAEVDANVYVLDLPVIGGPTPTVSVVNAAQASVPVRRLTRIGGDFVGWQPDGNRVFFSIGRSYFTYDLARADSLVRDSTARADSSRRGAGAAGAPRDSAAADSSRNRPAYEPTRLDVAITVPVDKPRGQVVLRNARVVTMKGDEVIERADILVRDNRIAAVGASGTLQLPNGTREIDVAGKTILPGFVDTHAHMWPDWGIHRSQVWMYMANLAYGVTTTRDPQTSTTDVLSYGDLVETGDIVGPRIFSTGPGVFWYDDIKSLADARDVLRRYSEFYHTNTIKQYMVGDRKVRQWVVMAARELGLSPTLEGGLDIRKNLTEAMDGYAGSEHSYPITPLFKDNVQMVAESGITYTPTLIVLYGGPFAENYWYEHYDITKDEKLNRFTPKSEILNRGLRRPGWWHDSQYAHSQVAAQAKKIMDAGGRVGVGSHGQLQGLGYHWEMWNIASGGATPMQVLRAATIHGADALGHAKDVGSIEVGKLADLLVLDANPLENLRNTNTVRFVMKNGRLYDANTLGEVWPRQRSMAKQWWMLDDAPPAPSGGTHEP